MRKKSDWIVSTSKRNIKSGFLELIESRAVLYALVKRELKARYRESFLGYLWALGKPLSLLLVFSLVIGEILGANRSIDNFALFIFVGLMFWSFFSEAVITGTNSIVNASGLVQKISFPREILPITSVVMAGVNLLIQIPVLVLGYFLFKEWPTILHLFWLLPLILILLFFTLGLVLILCSVNVYIRDVQPLTELGVMLLMYATPILYSWTFIKERFSYQFNESFLFDLYLYNPLNISIIGFQDLLWPSKRVQNGTVLNTEIFSFNPSSIWLLLFASGIFVTFAYRIFLKLEPDFAREL